MFLGELDRDTMAAAHAAADITLLMSEFEGSPNVALEAMASSRPVVATDVDGVRELIESGKNGVLVPRGDISGAAEALLALARSESQRLTLGAAGRAKIMESHGIDRNVNAHIALYERIMSVTSVAN
jgi:glycosyltransferase involved in cell wall biosynthesis